MGSAAADDVFTEWVAEPVAAGGRQLRLLVPGPDGLYAAGRGCCARLGTDGQWAALKEADPFLRAGVTALLPTAGGPWVSAGGGLAVLGDTGWVVTDDTFARGWGGVLTLAAEGETLWAGLSGGLVARRALDPAGPVLTEVRQLAGAVRQIGCTREEPLVASDAGLFRGRQRLSASPARALLPWEGGWLVACADGLLAVGASGICRRSPLDLGLPVRDVLGLAQGPGASVWAVTADGLCRWDGHGWHYHQGPRWLPDATIQAVAAWDGAVFAATPGGTVRLRAVPTTLEDRATVLLDRLQARHLRLGYVAETVGGQAVPSDNDGLWTALYLAAESYRFAVTGAPAARANADAAFAALANLEAVTTIAGYPTKAIVPAGTAVGAGERWYPSADGHWLWKGDCSSDEIVGHMYGYALYFDLVADAAARGQVAALVDRIMGAILDNDLRILEFGARTRWGYWYPEAVNGPEGRWGDRGLNSLEILSHLRVAAHITGSARYDRAYDELVSVHGYATNTLLCKVDLPGHVNHSDDELAFLAYDPLLRYERDPDLRAIYLSSLRRSWAFERPERNPLWNAIHAAHVGTDGPDGRAVAEGLVAAIRTLRELPTDTTAWPVRNRHRADVSADPLVDRHGVPQLLAVLPYDELAVTRWNGNPYQADGGNAQVEGDGVHFLLPYWMARHHGWLAGV